MKRHILGCATLIFGEVMALLQTEIKRMLAYSTLAQIGEIAAILGLGTALATSAALLHMSNHAVMKTLLFFAAGAFILQSGKRQIKELAGLGKVMPISAGCYALATVSIMGLPPFSGFISKSSISFLRFSKMAIRCSQSFTAFSALRIFFCCSLCSA